MNDEERQAGFVADGQERIHNTLNYRQKVQEIHHQIWTVYKPLLDQATWWQRLILRKKIHTEIQKACSHLAPDEALY